MSPPKLPLLTLILALAAPGHADFRHLATTDSGEEVFFVTWLRQPDAGQTAREKVFALDAGGLELLFEPEAGPFLGHFLTSGLNVSGDGSLVAFNVKRPCIGGSSCFLSELSSGYLLDRSAGTQSHPGAHVRISRNGRYAITWPSSGPMGASPAAITDRTTGQTVSLKGVFPYESRIAADGFAMLTTYGGLIHVSPEGVVRQLMAQPGEGRGLVDVAFSDSGTAAVYELAPERRLFVLDVATGATAQLGPDSRESYGATLSNDGEWVLYISVIGEMPQLFFSKPDGSLWRQLTASSEGVAEAVLSGDGRVAWVSTGDGRLLKVDTTTGDGSEILAPPVLHETGWAVPGSLIHLSGQRLGTNVKIDGLAAPVIAADDADIFAQVPWEMTTPGQHPPGLVLSVAREHAALEATTREYWFQYAPFWPDAVIEPVHEDWSGLITPESPARPGELIHIFATGLGPVDCAMETGKAAPLDRLCRPTTPIEWDYWWTETDSMPAEVPFAGLAPGLVGLYQIEARVPVQPPAERLKLIANRNGNFVVAHFTVR